MEPSSRFSIRQRDRARQRVQNCQQARDGVLVDKRLPTARSIIFKTVVTHTVTYFLAGVTAYLLFDYSTLIATTELRFSMRPLTDPMVMAGPAFQPVRGLLFGCVFYLLREPFFGRRNGWLVMWAVLVAIGILGTFGAPPGSLEGVIYTVLPLSLHLTLLPEVLVQSFLLSWVLFAWVNRPGKDLADLGDGCGVPRRPASGGARSGARPRG